MRLARRSGIALTLVLVAACGGSSPEPARPAEQAPTPATTSPPAAAEEEPPDEEAQRAYQEALLCVEDCEMEEEDYDCREACGL